ncbi:MAG: ATP-binding protein [Bdellovibrionales bacterium]
MRDSRFLSYRFLFLLVLPQLVALGLFGYWEYEKNISGLLILLILIGNFALVVALSDALYQQKQSIARTRAAEKNNALFAAALQSTRMGVLIRDMVRADMPIVFVNEAFTKMTGYTLEEVCDKKPGFLFGWNTDLSSQSAFDRAMGAHETAALELLLYRKDGSPFWTEWNLSPFLDKEGRAGYYVSLFTDISAIKQTQEDLIQAKAMAEQASAVKTSFLAMMSHEIRTPLNGILGVLKLLKDTSLDKEQRYLVSMANTSSSVLHGIINDILDYAKMEAGKIDIVPEPLSLSALLEEITAFSQALLGKKKITLEASCAPDVAPKVIGDGGRLRQLLLNLTSNAIKFTDEGRVTLRIVAMMPQEVDGKEGQLLRFEVQDSGMGISLLDQQKLFQEFSQIERTYTRRFGGTGLGLAICRRLVTLMKGEIGVESQEGKGSKFWFMLPLQIAQNDEGCSAVTVSEIHQPVISNPTREYRVLLVEDNEINCLIASRYLQKIGLMVEEAHNGLQAVEKAKEKDYDLILMDVSMPIMDGLESTRQIRALGGHNEKVPIVALTAHAMDGDREMCMAAGMDDYLNKPLECRRFHAVIERWLSFGGACAEEKAHAAPVPSSMSSDQSPLPKTGQVAEAVLFDPKVLERMKHDLGGEAVGVVTETFLNDSAKRILLFKEQDQGLIQETAHTLKSCSASCGLLRLSQLMADLEKAAKNQEEEKLQTLLPFVADIYALSRSRLEKEREHFME